LWGVFDEYNRSETNQEADGKAIAADWLVVGQELSDAIEQQDDELRVAWSSVTKRNRNKGNQIVSQKNGAIATVTSQSVSFSGPLPHPAILEKYNEIIPGGAERILAMAEHQSAHREHLERTVVEGNVKSQARGTLYGFIICLVSIVGGFALLFEGKNAQGLAAIISSLAALAGVFVYGRYKQAKERTDKADAIASRRPR
jgi:uncharacterized membrane protein